MQYKKRAYLTEAVATIPMAMKLLGFIYLNEQENILENKKKVIDSLI